MDAPSPGWHVDPTGRHRYRYWDGRAWTADVADDGTTSVDPVEGATGPADDPTAVIDATQPYATPAGPPGGAADRQRGLTAGGDGPAYVSGPVSPIRPPRAGPPAALIMGLAALAVAIVAGVAFVLVSDDDGETATDHPATDETATDETATDETATDQTAEPGDGPATDDSTADDGLDLGLDDIDADTSESDVVDILAAGLVEGFGGQVTQEQAECAAQAMVDEIGVDELTEMGTTGDGAFGSAGSQDALALFDAMFECIPMEDFMEIDQGGAGGGD